MNTTNETPTLAPIQAMLEINLKRKAVQEEIDNLLRAQEEYRKQDEAIRVSIIKGLPSLLGFDEKEGLNAVMGLLKNYVDSPEWKGKAKAPHGRPHTIPKHTKERALALRRQGVTTESIARQLGVSEASCWLWFRHAGLTKKQQVAA